MSNLTLSQFDLYFESRGASTYRWKDYQGTEESASASSSGWVSLLNPSLFDAYSDSELIFTNGQILIANYAIEHESEGCQEFYVELENLDESLTGLVPTQIRITYSTPVPLIESERFILWFYYDYETDNYYEKTLALENETDTIIDLAIDDNSENIPELSSSYSWGFILVVSCM